MTVSVCASLSVSITESLSRSWQGVSKPLKIIRIALPLPLRKIFDYLPAEDTPLATLQPGMRIRVPFQKRELVGIFLELASSTELDPKKLKPITAVLDHSPILPP
ncbi:MAG TPA: hypothetical protein VLH77_01275 [Gammaproteobacteria bacterium]|nr:hypothetical protein [Gammaproteobacteria bacterium]